MGSTKEMFIQIQEELLNVSNKCENGELSNLDALIEMRNAKQEAEKTLEIIKQFETDRINEIAHEAEQYCGKYRGFEIKSVNGRKVYNYKGISEIEEKQKEAKVLEEQYKNAFEGILKGIVQTTEVDGVKYWIDENGELKQIPELQIGKSYLTVKEVKIK